MSASDVHDLPPSDYHVVMESSSRVWLKAIPRGAEATRSVGSGETRARLPLAEGVLDPTRAGTSRGTSPNFSRPQPIAGRSRLSSPWRLQGKTNHQRALARRRYRRL